MAESARNLLDVVGDENDRRGVRICGQVLEPRHQFFATAEVESGRRLVEQQQLRVGHQGTCDQHPLALAFRQRLVRALGQVFGADTFQHVDGLFVVELLVFLPPAAEHRVSGRNDEVAHQLTLGHALRQR